ncbi:MAG: glycosyl transferase family 2, partial [Bacteroidota bacterium]|nr:glycosyl transferase family 2 [Bacteroidota bacterium]
MSYLEIAFLAFVVVFGLSLLFISMYSVSQIQLVLRYLKFKKKDTPNIDQNNTSTVCVQLPIYNELYVSKRLLEAVTKIKY